MRVVAGRLLADRSQHHRRWRRNRDRRTVHETRDHPGNIVPANADVPEHMVVQGSQLACGGDLPAHPPIGRGELFHGPDDSPEEAGEGRGRGLCLQPTPQELVLLKLVHGDVGAGNQVVRVAPVNDDGDPSIDSRIQ